MYVLGETQGLGPSTMHVGQEGKYILSRYAAAPLRAKGPTEGCVRFHTIAGYTTRRRRTVEWDTYRPP